MKYRFKIYEVSKDGGTGLVCGQAPFLITNFSTLTIALAVNGTEIHNGVFAVGGANPSVVVTTTIVGSITVTLTVQDTGQLLIEIPSTQYDLPNNLYIKVAKVGGSANTYENNLIVYGYDLGNDATVTNDLGLPVTNNPDMDIVLVDETATDTFTKFVGYNIPLTSNVALVELASGDGLTTYHKALTAEVVGTGLVTTASIQNLDYYSKSYRADSNVSCVSNNLPLRLWNYCPHINMSIINGRYDEVMVRSRVTGPALRTSLDFMDIARLSIDDVVTVPFISPRIVYTLRNRLGEVVTATTFALNFSTIFTAGSDNTFYDWLLPTLDITQNYTITAEIISDCQFNCVSTLTIPFCYTEDITHVECNSYVLTNNIPVTVTVSINKWNGTTFVEDANYILVADSSRAIELTDGVYQIRFTRGEEFYNRIVLADCGIRTCIMTLIQDFVCKVATIDCDCESTCSCTNVQYVNDKDLFDVNMINIQYIQYLNLVNHLLNLNPIFTTLNNETEAAIIQIDKLIQAFSVYCETCK
jgi:hypothetical protein